jgi:hypothetical protein
MALVSAGFHTGRYEGMCPNLTRLFSVSSVSSLEETEEAEEAPTFGRGSSHSLRVRKMNMIRYRMALTEESRKEHI